MGARHHFVPRFYLKAFSKDGRRIGVYNVRRDRVIVGASLRDQCYGHRLYGADEIEDALAQIEGVAAQVCEAIRTRHHVPGTGTPERDVLTLFIGMQLARTTAAQAHVIATSRLLGDVAFDGEPPDDFKLTKDQAVGMMLANGPLMGSTIGDLSVTLVLAPSGEEFATSDNPVFKYNMYCEGIVDFGVTGTQCRGLQLFFPVSPGVCLCLFDQAVYKLNRVGDRLVNATADDIAQINRLQLMSAHENIYFMGGEAGATLSELAKPIRAIREIDRPRITRAIEDEDSKSELLHQYWPMPQLGLQLSFLAVRSKHRAVPLIERIRTVRARYERSRPPEQQGGTWRRFAVKSRH